MAASRLSAKVVCVGNFLIKMHLVGDTATRFTKENVNKVNISDGIVLNMQVVPFDVHFHYIDNAFICIA